MKGKKPQKQLLQFVMLSLLSIVSVLVMANESYAALACNACHGTSGPADMRPLDAVSRDVSTGGFVGSHRAHMAPTATAPGDCAVCHTNVAKTTTFTSGHRDGGIQISAGVTYNKGVFFNQTSVPVMGSCATAVCHSSTSTTVGIATPAWGTTATCSSCHATSPITLSHQKHLVGTTFKKAVCVDCHASTVEGVSTAANHVDNSISVTGYTVQGKAKGSAVSTCSTTYCHSSGQSANGASATPVYAPVTWGGTVTCGSCHATTGMATGNHTRHIGKDTNCGNCHTGASATAYASTAHVDGSISVAAGIGYSSAATPGNGYGTCSTAACHSPFLSTSPNTVPTWGGALGCSDCHDNVQTTGAHSKHYLVAAVGFNCSRCHSSSAATTHANGFVNISGTLGRLMAAPVAKHAAGNPAYSATCTTTCHSAFTTAGTTPNWGAPGNCATCHDSSNTGAHNKHNASASVIAAAVGGLAANTCGVCHTNATTTAAGTGHANGVVNVIQVATGSTAKHAAGAYSATCTTACHNPDSTSVQIATPNWGMGSTCTTCHTAGFTVTGPSTGSHAAHTAATGATCTSCHAASTSTTVAPAAGHLDGNIDVVGVGYTADKAKGSAKTSCSTASCHANPYGAGTVTTPVWGVASGCKSCHTTAATNDFAAGPATGSHAAHMTTTYGTTSTCASCHTTPGSGATHNNNSINVIQYAGPVAKHAAGTYLAGGCATSTCHSYGGKFTPVAATWGADLDCAGCHGFPPAGTSHASVTNGNCNSCHSEVAVGEFTKTTATFATPLKHMNGVTDGGNCDACHGYPPVQSMVGMGVNGSYSSAKLQNYSGGGGAHNVAGHLALTLKTSNGNSFAGCVACHPSDMHNGSSGAFTVAQVQVKVASKYKFNSATSITYDRTGGAGSKTTGTCSNVSCHFQKTPIWSTQTFTQGH